MSQAAFSWVLGNPVVTAPVIGATRPGHLDDATAARGPGRRSDLLGGPTGQWGNVS